MARGRSADVRPFRPLVLAAWVLCAIWPSIVGILWLTTNTTVPPVKVRWAPGVADDTRADAERDLSLVWRAQDEPRTVTYVVMDSNAENIRRIVQHPLVEDTAFIDRTSYTLSHPSTMRTWAGDRFTGSWPWTLLYASLSGLFACLISLLYGAREQNRYAGLQRILFAALWLGAFVFTVSSF